jgi:hypothetical protein
MRNPGLRAARAALHPGYGAEDDCFCATRSAHSDAGDVHPEEWGTGSNSRGAVSGRRSLTTPIRGGCSSPRAIADCMACWNARSDLYEEAVGSAPPASFRLIGGIRSRFRGAFLTRRPVRSGALSNGFLFDGLSGDGLSCVLPKRRRAVDIGALKAEPDWFLTTCFCTGAPEEIPWMRAGPSRAKDGTAQPAKIAMPISGEYR